MTDQHMLKKKELYDHRVGGGIGFKEKYVGQAKQRAKHWGSK